MRGARTIGAVLVVAMAILLAPSVPAAIAAPADDGWQVVAHAGVEVTVPSSWQVVDLDADPTACLRQDVHAVYLGRPGAAATCPAHVSGRVSTVRILRADQAAAIDASPAAAAELATTVAGDVVARRVDAPDGRAVLVASTAAGPVEARIAASIRFSPSESTGSGPAAAIAPSGDPTPALGAARSVVRAAVSDEGFDTCAAPSLSQMAAWAGSSPYATVGIYIGGLNMGCAQANLTPAWVRAQLTAGWALIPTYVGRQAPCTTYRLATIDPAQAASQGTAAAADAVARAAALDIGPGSPIYLDLEGWNSQNRSCTDTVVTYLSAWTTELHRRGYRSGAYGSSEAGMDQVAARYATPGFARPDAVWLARWNGVHDVADPRLPSGAWAGHRIHQYRGSHYETYGGARIYIDSNVVDGDVVRAAASITSDNLLAGTEWGQLTSSAASTTVGTDVPGFVRSNERYWFTALVRSASSTPVSGELALSTPDGAARATSPFTVGATWTAVQVDLYPFATAGAVRAEVTLTTPDAALDIDQASLIRFAAHAPFRSWDELVAQQNQDFAGNPGTLASRAGTVAQLTDGSLTPTALVQRLMRGGWYGGHVAPVARLYWAYFGRIPDHGGLTYWVGRHRSGTRLAAISQTMATSHEFIAKTGGLSDEAFVARIYADVLGRTADAGGLAYWAGRLRTGAKDRGSVMVNFSESSENQRRRASDINTFMAYTGMLDRSPTGGELASGTLLPTYQVIERIRWSAAYGTRVG